MKTIIAIFAAVLLVLFCLNIAALKKISNDRRQIVALRDYSSNNVAAVMEMLNVIQMDNSNSVASLQQVELLVLQDETNYNTLSGLLQSSLLNADTNNHYLPIDPATGLPLEPKPSVFGIVGKVTEANDQWWRWAVQFSVANPRAEALDTEADIQFLDGQGFVIETKHEYHLKVDSYSTNRFSNYQLIELPGASSVKKVNVILEQE